MRASPPSGAHPLGTDLYSRDVLSRVIYGGRVSLSVAVTAVALSALVGTAYGAIAGFLGGRVDEAMMRIVDSALAVPRTLILIAVLALWGTLSVGALTLLLALTGWFTVSRLVRAEVRTILPREWVIAATALGAPRRRVIMRHVLPHVLAPVIVAATLTVGNVISVEAGLSYFGIGIAPPTPSWGNIMQEGSGSPVGLWWLSIFPGLAILVTTVAFAVVGEALREAMAPPGVHRDNP
ncbi:MAG: ABC transporter permease [Gemmatimonadaceae bacterium]